jgi:hypothetical protein
VLDGGFAAYVTVECFLDETCPTGLLLLHLTVQREHTPGDSTVFVNTSIRSGAVHSERLMRWLIAGLSSELLRRFMRCGKMDK